MAIISCPECGKQISDKAYHCIHCGCPIASASIHDSHTVVSPRDVSENPAKKSLSFKKTVEKISFLVKSKKKLFVIVSAVLVIAIIVSIASPFRSKLFEKEIILDKVYKADNVAEFVIKRVGTNKVLSTERQDNETFVDFFCKFTNISDVAYDDEDIITAYATGVKSKARYTNSYIRNTDKGMVITHDIQPHITKTMHIAVAVPVDEDDIIFSIEIKDKVFNFKYKMGNIYRNAESFEIGNTCAADDVAEIKINNIIYTTEASALKRSANVSGFRTKAPENTEEEVFLLIDMTYTNLKSTSTSGVEDVNFAVTYDDKYVYDSFDMYDVSSNEHILDHLYDLKNTFVSHGSARVFTLIKVSKKMMNKELELDFFIGEKEFVYEGTPLYMDFYPKDRRTVS